MRLELAVVDVGAARAAVDLVQREVQRQVVARRGAVLLQVAAVPAADEEALQARRERRLRAAGARAPALALGAHEESLRRRPHQRAAEVADAIHCA